MALTNEQIKQIKDEAEILYPNQGRDGNDIYHANNLADAKQEAHVAAVTAEREKAKVLVDGINKVIKNMTGIGDYVTEDVIKILSKALKQYNS